MASLFWFFKTIEIFYLETGFDTGFEIWGKLHFLFLTKSDINLRLKVGKGTIAPPPSVDAIALKRVINTSILFYD